MAMLSGLPNINNRFVPEKVKAFEKKNFVCVDSGQHHTMALDKDGRSCLC